MPAFNFDPIPIHVHQIDFTKSARIIRLKPGIHYAVNACRSEHVLRDEIRYVLNQVNDHNLPPAGFKRGGIRDLAEAVVADFTMGQRDRLYDLGINPILTTMGTLVLFGNLFVDGTGQKHRMVSFPEAGDPYRIGRVHPLLHTLASL